MNIRPAVEVDARGIAAVHVASWRAAYRGLLPQHTLDNLSVNSRTDAWRDIIRRSDGTTLVAVEEQSGDIRGFVNVGPSRDDDADRATVGELRAIYLHPDCWNPGTGRRLHEAGLQRLATEFAEATLWVLDTNTRARGFYEKHGWYDDGTAKSDERDGSMLREIRYRRALP